MKQGVEDGAVVVLHTGVGLCFDGAGARMVSFK
jgi:hypothetical protein